MTAKGFFRVSVQGRGSDIGIFPVRWIVACVMQDADYEVTVRFVSEDEMRELNLAYRGEDSATDVLAFSYDSPGDTLLGDIAVCRDIARRQAEQRGCSLYARLMHLILHGALHLIGWEHDDPKEAAQMEEVERVILARFNIANPYEIAK